MILFFYMQFSFSLVSSFQSFRFNQHLFTMPDLSEDGVQQFLHNISASEFRPVLVYIDKIWTSHDVESWDSQNDRGTSSSLSEESSHSQYHEYATCEKYLYSQIVLKKW